MAQRLRVAAAPISWGVIEVPEWGVQLPVDRVLREMSVLGATAIEFGPDGFLPRAPEARARILDKYGLQAIGGFHPAVMHDPARDPLPEVNMALKAYAACGATVLVLAAVTGRQGYDRPPALEEKEWSTLLSNLDRVQSVASAAGVTACLHPHLGTQVETPEQVERVVCECSIGICLDTGHYAVAGGDPADFVQQHADRVVHIHLKDVDGGIARRHRSGKLAYRDAVLAGMYRPLGDGDARIAEVVAALGARSYGGWFVLEQDAVVSDEAGARQAFADAQKSMRFLQTLHR